MRILNDNEVPLAEKKKKKRKKKKLLDFHGIPGA
jgi:hypothetical protein